MNTIPFPLPLPYQNELIKIGNEMREIRRKATSADLGKEHEDKLVELNCILASLKKRYS